MTPWIPLALAAGLIFDTDMGNDIDDALALAVIHALESRGEAKLLAVTVTKDNAFAAPYCDIVNTFYRRGKIPIGVVRGGKTPEDSPMIRVPVEVKPAYPHKLVDYRKAPEAVALIRRTLESQPDGSVVIVQVGFSTNLARLLASPGGPELIGKKVRLLSVMGGNFADGKPEYNVRIDIESASKVIHEWPGPIVLSGFEIGNALLYPARSIEQDFAWTDRHPVVDAYRAYKKMPYDRPTWDLTAVLYAVRPDRDYFTVSEPGRVQVQADGRTIHTPDPAGRHRYLKLTVPQQARTLEALIELASQPR
jgi:inosine-uridine nucleoside N-ribohydrolase